MYVLYHCPKSCSVAVKLALKICGLEFEIKEVNLSQGEQFSEDFKKISPLSKVPALKTPEGVLTEGAAILLYLAEKYPQAKLMPGTITDKMNAYKWLQFMYSTLHQHFVLAFLPDRFGGDADSIKRIAQENVFKLFALVNEQLEETSFIAGDKLSLADLYLIVAIHWDVGTETSVREDFPAVNRYLKKAYENVLISEVLKEEYKEVAMV